MKRISAVLNCVSCFCSFFFIVLIYSKGIVFAVCSNTSPSDITVRTTDVPLATNFRIPFGEDAGDNIDLLFIATFDQSRYPKIRFNDDGDRVAGNNEWYVATAFNNNRYLPSGFDADTTAPYSDTGDYHPGEDWNRSDGNDAGVPIYPIADGVVLFSDGNGGYGNTIIIVHKIRHGNNSYEYITSFYAHMQNISIYRKGDRIYKTNIIDNIGTTGNSTGNHLHFEIRKGPIVNEVERTTELRGLVSIDPSNNEICLTDHPTMWPAASHDRNGDRGQSFIKENYYYPTGFLKSRTTLSNGTEDGSASITLDPYGAFGSYTNAGLAVYDPIGPIGPASTTFQSALFFSPVGFFLNRGGPRGSNFGGSIYDGGFTSISATEAKSVFSVLGFDFELTQTLGPKGPGGSTLTQTYRITNNTGTAQNFDLIRHVDGDLYFDETLIDSGGASADGRTIFEFDSADNPNNPSTFVGISNEGGEGLGFHIGYRIAPFMFTDDIIRLGAGVLNNSIAGDSNGDRIIDRPYDVTLSLGNRFSNIAPAQEVSFATKTIFGSGSPIARAALPTGFIPVQENNDTINQGETRWQRFFNNIIQELRVILGFGSEFNLRVYQPDGTLFQEQQSTVSPIEVVIPNAQIGEWLFEITAIHTPIPNDPFVLVVGVPDTDEDGIPDQDDNCPNTSNPSQADADGDGIGDACEADTDEDGWIDDIDNCPSTSNPDQTDINGNGIGDVCEINPGDLNNDGIINTTDYNIFRTTLGKCTGQAGFNANADYDGDGCITYADYRIWYGYYKNQ